VLKLRNQLQQLFNFRLDKGGFVIKIIDENGKNNSPLGVSRKACECFHPLSQKHQKNANSIKPVGVF
jgi:hypothetical protein